jgi:hypothetical protein
VIEKNGLSQELAIKGGDWWPGVLPTGKGRADAVLVSSLLKQELIEAGVLMGPTFNLCLAHGADGIIDETLAAWRNDPAARLRGKRMQPVFQVRQQKPES